MEYAKNGIVELGGRVLLPAFFGSASRIVSGARLK
jgi:hypothetical protein